MTAKYSVYIWYLVVAHFHIIQIITNCCYSSVTYQHNIQLHTTIHYNRQLVAIALKWAGSFSMLEFQAIDVCCCLLYSLQLCKVTQQWPKVYYTVVCTCMYMCVYACVYVCMCEMCTWGKKISFAPIANPRIYVAKGYFW